MTPIWIAVILIGFLSLVNLGLIAFIVHNYSEKLGLLSSVAVQYLNEKEAEETKKQLSEPKHIRVVTQEFNSRRTR